MRARALYGVHIITSASSWPGRPETGIARRRQRTYQLRLSNPDETQMGTGMDHRRAARNTVDRPGFGVTRTGHELLIGLPGLRGPSGERIRSRGRGADRRPDPGPARWRPLPGCRNESRCGTFEPPTAAQMASISRSRSGERTAADRPAGPPTSPPAHRGPSGVRKDQRVGRHRSVGGCGTDTRSGAAHHHRQTTLIGRIQGRGVRAYAYTADDIDRTLASSPRS